MCDGLLGSAGTAADASLSKSGSVRDMIGLSGVRGSSGIAGGRPELDMIGDTGERVCSSLLSFGTSIGAGPLLILSLPARDMVWLE